MKNFHQNKGCPDFEKSGHSTTANEYEIYVAGLPLFLQKLLGFLLGGIAVLLGYRKFYPVKRPQTQTPNSL